MSLPSKWVFSWFSRSSICAVRRVPFPCLFGRGPSAKLPPSPGQTEFRAGSGEEAAGGGRGVGHDVHGEDRQSHADKFLQRAAVQVSPPRKPAGCCRHCRGSRPGAVGLSARGPLLGCLPFLSPEVERLLPEPRARSHHHHHLLPAGSSWLWWRRQRTAARWLLREGAR